MLTLEIPTYFNLTETLDIIRRGKTDPINYCDEGRWKRCLSLSNDRVLVEVSEKQGLIYIDILKGKMDQQSIKEQISKILGFDDPLIQKSSKEFSKNEYMDIKHVQSIPLPGYASLFETMIQTILGQQVSYVVANKMRCEFIKKFGESVNYKNKEYYIFPESYSILNVSLDRIKNIGVSLVKAKAIMSSAECFENQIWVSELADKSTTMERLYTLLTNIYGVGIWTASWFILRGLRKFDHVPATDLVVRKAMSWWWEKELLSASEIDKLSESMGRNKGIISYRIMLAYMKKFMDK